MKYDEINDLLRDPEFELKRIEFEDTPIYKIIVELQRQRDELQSQTRELNNYIAAQEAQKKVDDAQRILEAKKQRRNEWLIALASAGITQILNLVVDHFKEIRIALAELFH